MQSWALLQQVIDLTSSGKFPNFP